MPAALAQHEGEIVRAEGTIDRIGLKRTQTGKARPVVLLTNLQLLSRRSNYPKADLDHGWIDGGNWNDGLEPGDRIRFKAEVVPYRRGDPRNAWTDGPIRIGWKLHRPECVVKVKQ